MKRIVGVIGILALMIGFSAWQIQNPSSGSGTVTGGTCTNQVVTAISSTGVPTCTTATSSYIDSSIAPTASPTLTTPTIASFTNATHNHTNAAGGGQLTDSALSAAVGTAKGGTGVDLSAAGSSTAVLAEDGSHVVSARALIAADIPSLAASKITSGQLATAQGGTGVDSSGASGVAALNGGAWAFSSNSKYQVTWCASGCTNSALTSSLGATTLCLAVDCPAGFYHVVMYMYSTGTGCTTVGSGGVIPKLTYTDDVGAKSAVSGVNGGPNASGQGMAFTTGGSAASYVTWDIYTGGAQPIQVSTTLTACTTPGSFNGHNMRVTLWRVG